MGVGGASGKENKGIFALLHVRQCASLEEAEPGTATEWFSFL